ncbi:hypothetical protein ABZ816_30705 [Actinosynnema sp. NPDC047251]|uniref:Uncharacterized protein n=1 Tax=Saccharothrix espanaensis (strain ATCC 51144 / DSM 44229 / JCM 9112 / NBRC 15066 / NRRL 15764) TaxID=1179773 RepID=K0K788_SACES|nr:hypothetical protein [Saccharothrix espanaensis]CCH32759.1 hypothetical protein BN6_55000 [Saccharothrix espanaensis DSM 44229]
MSDAEIVDQVPAAAHDADGWSGALVAGSLAAAGWRPGGAGEAVESEWDDFGYGHHFGWRVGGLRLVIGVRQQDEELPVQVVFRVYNA